MPKTIRVGPDDCVVNISAAEGFFWQTIWDHPENRPLRDRRKDHNILKEGDTLYIPDRRLAQYLAGTEQRHRFVRKGVPVQFTLTLQCGGKPRANQHYVLFLERGAGCEGTSDGEGRVRASIPPGVREGRLRLSDNEEYVLCFGRVDPIAEMTGVQIRLRNLGFYTGEIDGEAGPATVLAIAEFQRSRGLAGNGALDERTRRELVAAHGS